MHSKHAREFIMPIKLASLALIVAFAAAAVAAWATSPILTTQAKATFGATQDMSPHELQQRIDIKSLPVQETGDLI
jgi:hypothetical protein